MAFSKLSVLICIQIYIHVVISVEAVGILRLWLPVELNVVIWLVRVLDIVLLLIVLELVWFLNALLQLNFVVLLILLVVAL